MRIIVKRHNRLSIGREEIIGSEFQPGIHRPEVGPNSEKSLGSPESGSCPMLVCEGPKIAVSYGIANSGMSNGFDREVSTTLDRRTSRLGTCCHSRIYSA
jgi:hypothetical protein